MHALEREQLPEERGRDERVAQVAQRAQRARQHAVERGVGLALLGDLVDGFEHRHRVREQRVLLAQVPVRLDRLDLGDDVELAAPVALERDPARRLEAGAELGRGLADPLGDRPHLAVARVEAS